MYIVDTFYTPDWVAENDLSTLLRSRYSTQYKNGTGKILCGNGPYDIIFLLPISIFICPL